MTDARAGDKPRPADEANGTLIVERLLPGTPERAFKAWTDPATLVKWWGPEDHTTPEYRMDVRPGGAYRITMLSPAGTRNVVSGVYREIAPPRRLAMSWAWERDGVRGHETEIVVTFEPTEKGTRLRLVQSVFQSREQRDNHNLGWTSSLNDLERLLAAD